MTKRRCFHASPFSLYSQLACNSRSQIRAIISAFFWLNSSSVITPCSTISLRQYRTKIVRQMRRQIFRQMKQKAEWILDVFTSIFVKYESLFRIWRMQIASSDFLRDEGKNGENPLWIFEYFPEISRKICTQDACGKIRNRLWREICKQMACKVARRSLCGFALDKQTLIHILQWFPEKPLFGCVWCPLHFSQCNGVQLLPTCPVP